MSSIAAPIESKEVVESAIRSRYSYTKEELFEFRLERSSAPPHDLPSFAIERSGSVEVRGARRLGPGGASRSGGAGAGGGLRGNQSFEAAPFRGE
jgi:hypothetical protein